MVKEMARKCIFSDSTACGRRGNAVIPRAVLSIDLYDKLDVVSFDKKADFFRKMMQYCKQKVSPCAGRLTRRSIMNILTAYFSYTEHTRGIARQVQSLAGGTLFEIRPAERYSSDYGTTERQARKETQDGYHPPLAEQVKEFASYDVILLGTPNWFNTVASPVAAFLAGNDFSGKKIGVFCTHGGGGMGHILTDVRKLASGAELLESLRLYEDGGIGAGRKIEDWLKKNGLV